jgi:hypothetical protein
MRRMTTLPEPPEQDRQTFVAAPMDVAAAEAILLETKEVLDAQGIRFFLRQGTCLGAVRDAVIIPWDDDIDIASVMGMHGLTMAAIEPAAEAFREKGFKVDVLDLNGSVYVGAVKYGLKIDWFCYVPTDGYITQHPGIRIPIDLLENLKTIDFLGTRFDVPNPPERYLEIKYGPDWRTPKHAGEFERDVLALLPVPRTSPAVRLARSLIARLRISRRATIRVLDENDAPVSGATITLMGRALVHTNASGIASFYLRAPTSFATMVGFNDVEEILYDERYTPGLTHTYRRDPAHLAGRLAALAKEPTK